MKNEDPLAEARAAAAAEAEAEQLRMAQAQRARERAADAERRIREAHARASAKARIEAEETRQRLAEEARLAARAPKVEPVVPERIPVPSPAAVAAPMDFDPAPRKDTGFWFVVVGLPVLCLTAIIGTWIYANRPVPEAAPVFAVPAPVLQIAPALGPATAFIPQIEQVDAAVPVTQPAAHKPKARKVRKVRKAPKKARVNPDTGRGILIIDTGANQK